jgi:hypothetical protein
VALIVDEIIIGFEQMCGIEDYISFRKERLLGARDSF